MTMAFNAKASSVQIDYKVNTTGDAWFQPTVASSDSPDYTVVKAEAVTACQVLSPTGVESVA